MKTLNLEPLKPWQCKVLENLFHGSNLVVSYGASFSDIFSEIQLTW